MSDKSSWKTARLIPVVGIKGDREKEQRATSAFLAVLSIVRPFSHDLLTKMGASSAAKATVETFTEVKIGSGEQSVRPDGVVRVTFGSKSFTALVEVKTGDNKL
ncbi:MAG TPA: stress response protein, partial [Dehalococcoidia bacterium]|nr:stress response protein [Dehalococcoidia bacterium]